MNEGPGRRLVWATANLQPLRETVYKGNQSTDNVRLLKPQEVLFRESDKADCAYIIENGKLEISTYSEGHPVVICHLSAGDIVGEMGVIDSAPRTATATACEATRLIVVTRDQLTERISQADPILKLLVKILLDRYRSGLRSVKGESTVFQATNEDLISEEVIGEYVRHGIDKIRLEAELKEALANHQLSVRYQPMVDLANRRIAGFEALTRWRHPQRGQISPGMFIGLAEETKLIVPVGLYVFEQASAQLERFNRYAVTVGHDQPLFMSINVSARQITDRTFIDQAAHIVAQVGLNPGQIKLEVTESLAIDVAATERWIRRAHDLGFKVSLDDFGTGYSSLATLSQLQFDTAKIDQAFVRPLLSEPRSRELLRGIVLLLRGLSLEIVVEGIECEAEFELITELGCDYGQGYLIGKSLRPEEAEKLIATGFPGACGNSHG